MFCFHVSVLNLELSADAATCWKLPSFPFSMTLAKLEDLISCMLQRIGVHGDILVSWSNWVSNSWKNMIILATVALLTFLESDLVWAGLSHGNTAEPVLLLVSCGCCWLWSSAGARPRAVVFLIFSKCSLEKLFCQKITTFMVHKRVWAAFLGIYTPWRWGKPTCSLSPVAPLLACCCSRSPSLVLSLRHLQCLVEPSPGDTRGQSHPWGRGRLALWELSHSTDTAKRRVLPERSAARLQSSWP